MFQCFSAKFLDPGAIQGPKWRQSVKNALGAVWCLLTLQIAPKTHKTVSTNLFLSNGSFWRKPLLKFQEKNGAKIQKF